MSFAHCPTYFRKYFKEELKTVFHFLHWTLLKCQIWNYIHKLNLVSSRSLITIFDYGQGQLTTHTIWRSFLRSAEHDKSFCFCYFHRGHVTACFYLAVLKLWGGEKHLLSSSYNQTNPQCSAMYIHIIIFWMKLLYTRQYNLLLIWNHSWFYTKAE